MGVTFEGWDEAFDGLERAAQKLEDERAVAEVAIKGMQPMVERVSDLIGTGSPWRETGHTAADIHASVDKESEVGTVKIAIGASKKHAFKVRLQEFGTSKQPAYPSLRPGHDETIAEVKQNIFHGMVELMKPLVGR